MALAWLLNQGDDIVPIPATNRRRYLEENLTAADLRPDHDDLGRLDAATPIGAAAGLRYGEQLMAMLDH